MLAIAVPSVLALAGGVLLLPRLLRNLRADVRKARLDAEHADRAAAAAREGNAHLQEKVRALQERLSACEREACEAQRRAEAASEAHRLKCEFLDHVSRELRGPLNAVIGFSTLLVEEARPDQQQHLRSVHEGGRRMLKVLNQMVELSRIEATGVSFEEVEAAELVAAAAISSSRAAGQRGVELCTRAPDLSRLRCDVAKLRQVLETLLANAISCTPQGASVEVSASQRGPLVRFSVEDQGGGLDQAAISRLFDAPTEDGKEVDLALCRRVVELHGGAIEVASRPGAGCVVSFTLPAIT